MTTTEQLLQDITAVVEMYWADEQRHWEESDMPKEHIFNALNRLNTFIAKEHNDNA